MNASALVLVGSLLAQGVSPTPVEDSPTESVSQENNIETPDTTLETSDSVAKEGEAPSETSPDSGDEGPASAPEGTDDEQPILSPEAEFVPEPVQTNWVHGRLGLGTTRVGKQAIAGTEFSAVFRYESDNFAFEFSPFEMLIDFSGESEALRWGVFHFNALYMLTPAEDMSFYGGGGIGMSIFWVDGAEQDYDGGGFEFRLIAGMDYNRFKATRLNVQLELLLPTYSLDRSSYNDDPHASYSPMLLLRTGVSVKTEIGIGQRIQNALWFWFHD